jgi:predicted anti-sigma-YlaC factor YlaD
MSTRRATGILTAGVAAGLFASRLLGDLVPDSLAASVCMFAAGSLSGGLLGVVAGFSWGRERR